MSSVKLYSCHPQCVAIRSLIEFLNTIVNNGMAFKRCIFLLSGNFLLMWSCEAVEDLSGRTLSYSTNPIATRPQIQLPQFYKSNCHTDSNEIHSHYKTYSAAVSIHHAYVQRTVEYTNWRAIHIRCLSCTSSNASQVSFKQHNIFD